MIIVEGYCQEIRTLLLSVWGQNVKPDMLITFILHIMNNKRFSFVEM